MRGRLLTVLGLAAALIAAGAAIPSAEGAPGKSARTHASVQVVKCSRELHTAVFRGRMHQVPASERMWMRFTLLQRTGLEGYVPVEAPGLGVWRKSRRGVFRFGYRQGVRNLSDASVYRTRVEYRWYSAEADLIQGARRKSATCPSTTELPNLGVRLTGVRRTPNETFDRYTIRVFNLGQAPAKDVLARLAVDGLAASTAQVGTLAPGQSRLVTVRGPECGSFVQAQVDPDAAIAESNEQDNSHQRVCASLRSR